MSGVESLMDYQASLIGERCNGKTEMWVRGGGAGHQPVPLLEEDLRATARTTSART